MLALRKVKEAGLILEDEVRLCAIADGAPWIWKWVGELFAGARQILDYHHCWRQAARDGRGSVRR